jgi:putative sterol carrier protein
MATVQEVSQIFPTMASRLIADKAQGVNAIIQFNLSGDNGGLYWLKIADGKCESGEGQAPADQVKMTLKAAADDWHAVSTGKMNPMQAFMSGKIKIEGDMGMAMKLQTMFAQG